MHRLNTCMAVRKFTRLFILLHKTVALHLTKSSKFAITKASSFYGAGRTVPRTRFLAFAKNAVESQESDTSTIGSSGN